MELVKLHYVTCNTRELFHTETERIGLLQSTVQIFFTRAVCYFACTIGLDAYLL